MNFPLFNSMENKVTGYEVHMIVNDGAERSLSKNVGSVENH